MLKRMKRNARRWLAISTAAATAISGLLGPLFSTPSRAAGSIVYWDSDGNASGNNINGTGLGGSGIWDAGTTSDWWDGISTDNVWNNSGADSAVFSGTPGTVTLSSPIDANSLTFTSSGYTLTGGSLSLTSGGINVGTGLIDYINSTLTGTAGLIKTGDGDLNLTGAGANTYTGDTVINGGSVVITNQNQLGSSSTVISVNGINNTGNPGYSGGQLVLQGGWAGTTLTRGISLLGGGPNAANGSGALLSIGNNTFTGNIQFGGTPAATRISAEFGTTTFSGGLMTIGIGQNNIFQGNGNIVINDQITGNEDAVDRFIKTGNTISTTLTLANANNNFLEVVRIDSGTIRVFANGALGIGTLSTTTQGQLDLNGGTLEVRSDLSNDFATRSVRVRGNNNTIFLGRAIGGSAINEQYAFGNFDFDSNSTFNSTSIDGLGLSITGIGGLITWSSGNPMTMNNNSSGLFTINASISRPTETTARTLTIGGNGDSQLTGYILQPGAAGVGNIQFSKTGTGTLSLTGANTSAAAASTFNGTTYVQGTLQIAGSSSTIASLLGSGAAIALASSGTTAGALDYRGPGETTSEVFNLYGTSGAGILLANESGTTGLTLTNTIGAGGAGSKTFFLGGNSPSGTINSILGVIDNNSASNITSLTKVGSGTWLYSPSASSYAAGLASGTVTGTGSTNTNLITLSASNANIAVGETVTGTNVPSGSIVTAVNGTSITISNNISIAIAAGTALTFSANSNFTGGITVGGGTLQVQPTASTGNGANLFGTSQALTFNTDTLTGNGYAGGTFELIAPTVSIPSNLTQSLGALTLTAGNGKIAVDSGNGGNNVLSFASLGTRAAGATVNFDAAASNAQIVFGTTVPTGLNGIIGGFAYLTNPTTGAIDFAAKPSAINTNITALGASTELPATGATSTTNYANTGVLTLTTAEAFNSLRIVGAGQTIDQATNALTVTNTSATATGGILLDNSAGGATITGGNIAGSVAASELIFIVGGGGGLTPANALTVNSTIGAGAASAFTKAGNGLMILGSTNTFTGNVVINEGEVQLAANSATATLGSPANATTFTLRQGTIFDLNGAGASVLPYTGAAGNLNTVYVGGLSGAGTITNSGTSASALSIGGSTSATATGVFSGLIQDGGTGPLTLIKAGTTASVQALTGLNTYTGATIINGGVLQATTLANGGQPSSIGQSSNAASNLVFANGGELQYTGSSATIYQTTQTQSVTTDRLFTLAGNGIIDSSGSYGNDVLAGGAQNNAALVFTNTASIALAGNAGSRTLTLQGSSIGDNAIDLNLADQASPAITLAITKAGPGHWVLSPSTANTYSGTTTISGGALEAVDGIGLSSNSLLTINGGVFQTAGTFSRTLGTGAGQVQLTGGTSGFAASTAPLTITLGGGDIAWGGATFNPTSLDFGSTSALFGTTFTNNINLGATGRTIQVDTNGNTSTAQTQAYLSGMISGGLTTGTSLTKQGGGNLILGDSNTYTGNTAAANGSLTVTSIGASGVTSSSIGTNTTNAGSLLLGSGGNAVNVLYVGPGEITTRPISFVGSTGTIQIDSSGSGPLVLTNITNNATGAFTLGLRGLNADTNMLTAQLTNGGSNALTVTKSDGGIWVLNPSTADTFTGAINASGGLLGLTANGIGSASSVVLNNGGVFAYGDLTTSTPFTLANNATGVFAGTSNITINANVSKASGNNNQTVSNNLQNGAVLTVNGNFLNLDTTASATHTISFRGYGSTVWNGIIQDSSTATDLTFFDIRLASAASFTLAGGSANTYTGGTLLGQGTLILDKVGALGTGIFTWDGGVLQGGPDVGDLTGANKLTNNISMQGDPMIVSGSSSLELGGTVTLNASRLLINNLGSGTLTISGGVTNSATATLTIAGSGASAISGNVGTGTGTQSLTYSGAGSLSLTGTNTATGTLTLNRGLVTLSGTSGGTWNAGTFALNAGGTLRLDNSGGDNPSGRLNDSGAITTGGGTLDFIGSGTTSETAGALTINTTPFHITTSAGSGGTLTFASLNFASSGGALDLNAVTGLGTTNKIKFTTSTGLGITNSIAPRVFIGGNDFAAYDATNGVVAFTAYNTGNNIDSAAATDTLKITAPTVESTTKTVNAVLLNGTTLSATGSPVLTLAAGGILANNGPSTLSVPEILSSTVYTVQVASGATLNITGSMASNQAFSKALPGTLTLSAPQFLGTTVNVVDGTLVLNGGLNTLFPTNASLVVARTATVDLNGNSQYIGTLTDPGQLPGDGGIVTNSSATAATFVSNLTGSSTYAGQITGSAMGFGRVGGNTLTFESAQTYHGATTLMGGTTSLQDDGTLLNTDSIAINYATLNLSNNTSLQTDNPNRVSDTAPISLRGGTITFTGRVDTFSSETMGALTVNEGANTITANASVGSAGAFGSAALTFTSLTRSAGTTVNFTGTNLGSPGNNAAINFTTPLTPVNQGVLGAWAIANTTDYAAYNTGNGIGVVGSAGFAPYDVTFGSGNITNLGGDAVTGTVSLTTPLPNGGATTALLRLAGAFENDITFAAANDVLNLQLGGLLRSNNAGNSVIGTTSVPGVITTGGTATTGNTELVAYVANSGSTVTINSVIANNGLGATTSLTKSGAGSLTLANANTYTGGTFVSQGTLTLAAPGNNGIASFPVIPGGTLTIDNASVVESTNSGQIAPSTSVVMNGGSALTLAGSATFAALAFNNDGSTTTPTLIIPAGAVLTIVPGSLAASSSNPATTATISGGLLDFNNVLSPQIVVNAIQIIDPTTSSSAVLTALQPTLNITSAIQNANNGLTVNGGGLLQLGGQSTFTGGVTVATGSGLIIAANSTPGGLGSTPLAGPVGTGALTLAANSVLGSTGNFSLSNNLVLQGNLTFIDLSATSPNSLTFNGNVTLPTGSPFTINIPNPLSTLSLAGPINSTAQLTKTGLGTLILSNTNPGVVNLVGGGPISFLSDGDGSGASNVAQTFAGFSASGGATTVTINRLGTTYAPYYSQASNHQIQLTQSFDSGGNQVTVTNSSGYGLDVTADVPLVASQTYTVANASLSNAVPGLQIDGVVSGTSFGIIKTGAGTLLLSNASNSFGGASVNIDIQGGTLAATSAGALGANGTIIDIDTNASAAAGFRAAGTFDTTNHPVNFAKAANAIEVTNGNTLTIPNAFTFNGSSAAASLTKNDLGTLAISASNPSWTGAVNINEGAILAQSSNALGSGTITINTAPGSALQLSGSITLANPIALTANSNSQAGIQAGGAIESVSGVNTITGAITQTTGSATAFGADLGATLTLAPSAYNVPGTNSMGLLGAGTINLNFALPAASASVNKYGTGTTTLLAVSSAFVNPLNIFAGTFVVGGTGSANGTLIGGTGLITVTDNSTLTVDNSSGTSTNNRLGGRPIALNGGTFNYIGAVSASSETLGTVTFPVGGGQLAVNVTAGAAGTALNFGAIPQGNGSGMTAVFSGNSLGTAAGANVATIASTTTGITATGNSFIANNTSPNQGIVPWALVATTPGGTPTSFLTATPTANGTTSTGIFRPLASTEYASSNTFVTTDNIQLTSGTTNTGTLTINSLTLSGGSATISALNGLTISSDGILATASGSISGGILVNGNNPGVFFHTVGASTTLTFASLLTGTAGITSGSYGFTKGDAGTLLLNTPTSIVSSGGSTSYFAGTSVNTYTGQIAINQGTVTLGGGTDIFNVNNFVRMTGGTLEMNGNSQAFYDLIGDPSNVVPTTGLPVIQNSSVTQSVLAVNDFSAGRNFAGSINGNIYFALEGKQTLNLLSSQSYAGATLVSGSTLDLQSNAALTGTTSITVNYGSLTDDNSSGIYAQTGRLGSAPLTLNQGTLTLNGRTGAIINETSGAITLGQGYSQINVVTAAQSGSEVGSVSLTAGALARTAGSAATINFNRGNMGLIGNNPAVFLNSINGTSTLGTTTVNGITVGQVGAGLTNSIIGGWAIVQNDFASYTPGTGVGALNAAGYAGYDFNNAFPTAVTTASSTQNVRLTTATAIPSGGAAINALSLSGSNIAQAFTTGTDTLNLTSGGLIGPNNNQTFGASIDSGRLTAGGLSPSASSDLYVFNQGNTFTINSRVVDNSSGSGSSVRAVFTVGGGNITLADGANSYTGGTVVNGTSTLSLSAASGTPVPAASTPVNGLIINGATVTMNAVAQQIASGNIVTINGSGILNLFGNNSLAGLVFNNIGGGATPSVNTFQAVAGASGVLTLGSAGVTLASDDNLSVTATVNGRLDLGSLPNTVSVAQLLINNVNIAPLQPGLILTGIVNSTGGFTKTGLGVLQISGQGLNTGPVNVSQGMLQFGSTDAGSRFADVSVASGAYLNLNGATTEIGSLAGAGTVINASDNNAGAQTLYVGFDNNNSNFSGQLQRWSDNVLNSIAFTKIGTGTMLMTGDNSTQASGTISDSAINVNGGTLSFNQLGRNFVSTSSLPQTYNVNSGGTLAIDNSSNSSAALNNRLGINAAGTLNLQGGTLSLIGNATTAVTESIAILNVQNGEGQITMASNGANANFAITTIGNANSTGSAFISGLTTTQGTGHLGTAYITLSGNVSSQGQGTNTNGTATMPVNSAIIASNGTDTGFVVKDSVTGGLRPLQLASPNSEYLSNSLATSTTTTNNYVNSAQSLLANPAGADTITLAPGASIASGLPSAYGLYGANAGLLTLPLTVQGVLALNNGTTAQNYTVSIGQFGSTAGATGEVHILGSNTTLTVSGYLFPGATSGMIKADDGTLVVNKPLLYTGNTIVNGGSLVLQSGQDNTVAVEPTAGTTPGISNLQVNGTATLDLHGNSQVFGQLSSNAQGNGVAGLTGGTITNSQTGSPVTLTSVNTNTTWAGQITGNLNFTRSNSSSTTTITNNNSYTGATTIRGGTLVLQDSGAFSQTTSVEVDYATLQINQLGLNPSGTPNPVRLPVGAPITSQGATLQLNGAGSTDSSWTINTLNLGAGRTTLTSTTPGSSGATSTITLGSLVQQSNTAAFDVTGSGLGSLGINNSLVTAASIAPFGGSAVSPSSLISSGILPPWININGLNSNSGDFANYNANGFVAATYSGNSLTTPPASTDNINTGANTTLTTTATMNSLRVTGTTTLTLGSGIGLVVNSGGLLTAGNNTVVFGASAGQGFIQSNTNQLWFDNYAGTNTLNAVVQNGTAGAVAFIMNGTGNTTMNALNTYTGGTIVSAGTLTLGATATLPAPTSGTGITLNGIGALTQSSGATIAPQSVQINGGGVLTLAGASNTLTTLAFNNTGSITGQTPTVAAGTLLVLSGTGAGTGVNDATIGSNNPSFSFTPTISGTALQLSNASPVIYTTGLSVNDLIISAPITNAGGTIVKQGPGALALSGASTFTNGFTLAQGSLVLGASTTGSITNGPIGTGTLTLASGTSILSDGTARTIANAVTAQGDFTFGGVVSGNNLTLSGPITLGNSNATQTITVNTEQVTGTISGKITGTNVTLIKDGPGFLTLSNAANAWGTLLQVNQGVLTNGIAGAVPAGTDLTVGTITTPAQGAVFNDNGIASQVLLRLSGTGLVTNSGGAQTLYLGGTTTTDNTSTPATATFSGSITAATPANLALTKVGLGTQVLSGTNAYAGATTINGGTLAVSSLALGGTASGMGASSNAAANLVINGATLQYLGNGDTTDRQFTLGTAGGTLDASGAGPVVFSNTAAITLSGTNTARTFNLAGTNTANNTLASGIANNGTGITSLVKSGAGTWALSSGTANTYTGNTTIQGGTLKLITTGNNNIEASPNLIVGDSLAHNSAALDVTGVSPANGFQLADGQTLSGFGTILSSSTVNVVIGATGTTAAGNQLSPGTPTATGKLTITSGTGNPAAVTQFADKAGAAAGTYNWKLNTDSGYAGSTFTDPDGIPIYADTTGTNWDALNMDSLQVSGTHFTINVGSFSGGSNPGTSPVNTSNNSAGWVIAHASDNSITQALAASLVLNTTGFSVTNQNNAQFMLEGLADPSGGTDLVVAPTPEPTSLALIGLAAGGLMLRRRRRPTAARAFKEPMTTK